MAESLPLSRDVDRMRAELEKVSSELGRVNDSVEAVSRNVEEIDRKADLSSARLMRWQRTIALPQIRDTVNATLTTTQLRRAYELCDGTRNSIEVAQQLGVSKQAFSGWTRRWRNLGIAHEVEGRRIKHLVSLASLEIPLEVESK